MVNYKIGKFAVGKGWSRCKNKKRIRNDKIMMGWGRAINNIRYKGRNGKTKQRCGGNHFRRKSSSGDRKC